MLDPHNTLPEWLHQSGAKLVNGFRERDIIEALKA
jgi:hypothetical protein